MASVRFDREGAFRRSDRPRKIINVNRRVASVGGKNRFLEICGIELHTGSGQRVEFQRLCVVVDDGHGMHLRHGDRSEMNE